MRFAIANNNRVEANPGLKAFCPGCSQPVVAKCGNKRIHHWAHYSQKICDHWWEPETEWHRKWKDNFPIEWQEIFLADEQLGKKHIADVQTPEGLVIEFQHSNIIHQERTMRENFYKQMIWVVDGTRLKKDFPRFVRAKNHLRKGYKPNIFHVECPEKCFPSAWTQSPVPIIFDFFDSTSSPEEYAIRQPLYYLLPIQIGSCKIIAEIPRKEFIETIRNGEWSTHIQNFSYELDQVKLQQHENRRRNKERYSLITGQAQNTIPLANDKLNLSSSTELNNDVDLH